MTAIGPSRIERLATWLGHRWCGLITRHRYIRQPDPWRIALVCWYCGRESAGWSLAPISTNPAPVSAAIVPPPQLPLASEAIEP